MRLGAKAAPHDAKQTAELDHVTFLETVLFAPDIRDVKATTDAFRPYNVEVVHQPFTVEGGHTLDVADPDRDIAAASRKAWDATLHMANELDAKWAVLHPGGIAPTDLDDDARGIRRADALEATTEALQSLVDQHGKQRILLENLPDHYGHPDGRVDQSLTLRGVVDWMGWSDLAAGLCLDTSHAGLTAGGLQTLGSFLARAGPRIKHLHLSDAVPPQGEGAAIGAPGGIIPWPEFARQIKDLEQEHGEITGVPEIRDGHTQGQQGFKVALGTLHDLFA